MNVTKPARVPESRANPNPTTAEPSKAFQSHPRPPNAAAQSHRPKPQSPQATMLLPLPSTAAPENGARFLLNCTEPASRYLKVPLAGTTPLAREALDHGAGGSQLVQQMFGLPPKGFPVGTEVERMENTAVLEPKRRLHCGGSSARHPNCQNHRRKAHH